MKAKWFKLGSGYKGTLRGNATILVAVVEVEQDHFLACVCFSDLCKKWATIGSADDAWDAREILENAADQMIKDEESAQIRSIMQMIEALPRVAALIESM